MCRPSQLAQQQLLLLTNLSEPVAKSVAESLPTSAFLIDQAVIDGSGVNCHDRVDFVRA
jgi:hypothetical protein